MLVLGTRLHLSLGHGRFQQTGAAIGQPLPGIEPDQLVAGGRIVHQLAIDGGLQQRQRLIAALGRKVERHRLLPPLALFRFVADQLFRLLCRCAITLQGGEGGEANDRRLLVPTFLQQLLALADRLAILLVVVIEAGQTQTQGIVGLECQCRLVTGDGA
ncbi:hypothetical protein D3C85_884650 [compost metagenome]